MREWACGWAVLHGGEKSTVVCSQTIPLLSQKVLVADFQCGRGGGAGVSNPDMGQMRNGICEMEFNIYIAADTTPAGVPLALII